MTRPIKCRRITFVPGVAYFKPVGVPVRCLEEVIISVEEAEAVRLKDVEHLEHEEGAEQMNISRPTFQRVLTSARHKLADALMNGKAVRIEGGHFEVSPGRFRCANGHEWEVPFESTLSSPIQMCPNCHAPSIEQLSPTRGDCPLKGRSPCCLKCSRAMSKGSSRVRSESMPSFFQT
jgi:uncharacterized protein